jgi:hypothetical protein
VTVGNVVASQPVASGRPVEVPEAVRLAGRSDMGKADEPGDVLDRSDRTERTGEYPGIGDEAEVAKSAGQNR